MLRWGGNAAELGSEGWFVLELRNRVQSLITVLLLEIRILGCNHAVYGVELFYF